MKSLSKKEALCSGAKVILIRRWLLLLDSAAAKTISPRPEIRMCSTQCLPTQRMLIMTTLLTASLIQYADIKRLASLVSTSRVRAVAGS